MDVVIAGEQLRTIRQNAGLSQADLAHRVYVSQQTVSCWECGRRRMAFRDLQRVRAVLEQEIAARDEMTRWVREKTRPRARGMISC